MNVNIDPIKSLYFESGSKHLKPGEKYSLVFKWLYFSLFRQYLAKIVNICPFYGALSLHVVKTYFYDVITNEPYLSRDGSDSMCHGPGLANRNHGLQPVFKKYNRKRKYMIKKIKLSHVDKNIPYNKPK